MILVKCTNCQHEEKLTFVKTIKGVMYDRAKNQIKCHECDSFDLERVFTDENEGMPALGKYSATNEYNRKR